jgi:hypothetical protein
MAPEWRILLADYDLIVKGAFAAPRGLVVNAALAIVASVAAGVECEFSR